MRRSPGDEIESEADSVLGTGWGDTLAGPQADRAEPGMRSVGAGSALTRIHRTYIAARASIGVALVVGIVGISVFGQRPPAAVLVVCIAYAVQSLLGWIRGRAQRESPPSGDAAAGRRQWLATIGVDLFAFGALHVLATDATLNFGALLVLPVLMSGVLASRRKALATAAGVSLMLLAVAWHGSATSAAGAALITQSGLAGLGLFLIALLSSELSARLVREQLAARDSLALARQQARLNRLVIEEMADGVLVVDRELRVRAVNPAARELLSVRTMSPGTPIQLQSRPEWSALADTVRRAIAEHRAPDTGVEVPLDLGAGGRRRLRMRVRFTRQRAGPDSGGEQFCVLLLEDVRTAQARSQQEKLAAMGRVSAGIAHEIRNPLAAIAQANALLLEDRLSGPQQRLARMVAENVERLRRIVDDVMEVAPGALPEPVALDAGAEVAAAAAEWARTAGVALGPESRLRLDLPLRPLRVFFDRDHLRRVLVNLLDNACRHASDAPGAIGLRLAARDDARALLLVDSDGAPIPPDVEPHLFEPFFSTRSRGTGLGLYICRELCERYGASIEYRLQPDDRRNLFLVTMRREAAGARVSAAEGGR
jgi:two-component system sensor histidine kinase PilS (NtrC family)